MLSWCARCLAPAQGVRVEGAGRRDSDPETRSVCATSLSCKLRQDPSPRLFGDCPAGEQAAHGNDRVPPEGLSYSLMESLQVEVLFALQELCTGLGCTHAAISSSERNASTA